MWRVGMIAVGLGLFLTSFSLAQLSTDEATARLKAKQAERDAARATVVQISAGELQDLREKLKALEAENAELRAKVNGGVANANAGAAAKPVPKKKFTKLELGMTRQEVESFLAQHPNDYKVIGVSANAGVRKSVVETTVSRQQQQQVNMQQQTDTGTTVNGSNPANRSVAEGQNTNTNTGTAMKENVERKVNTGRVETMTIAVMGSESYVSGHQKNALGRPTPVYDNRPVRKGRIAVEFTDDIVTNLEAFTN